MAPGDGDTLQIPWEKAFVETLLGVNTTSRTLPGKAISAETWLSVPSSSQNNTKRFVIVSEHICFALGKKKTKTRTPKFYLTSTFPVCKNTETCSCQMRKVLHPMGGCISNSAEREPTHAGNATQEKSQHSDFLGEPRFSRSELSAVFEGFLHYFK